MSVYKILTNTKELIDKKYELLQEIKKINEHVQMEKFTYQCNFDMILKPFF